MKTVILCFSLLSYLSYSFGQNNSPFQTTGDTTRQSQKSKTVSSGAVDPITFLGGYKTMPSFRLLFSARVSAGVFTPDGELVRTLFSGVPYSAGTHRISWDGLDDSGNQLANSIYQIRITINNVKYEWLGVVGNTSDALTGPSVHIHSEGFFLDMAIGSQYAYCASGYEEGGSSKSKFRLDDPNKSINILDKGIDVKAVATNEQNVYWFGIDPNSAKKSFVVVTSQATDMPVFYKAGIKYKTIYGETYTSVIGMDSLAASISDVRGIAVTSKYIFLSYTDQNKLRVLDIITGEVLQTISISSPKKIKNEGDSGLWVITNDSLKKYAINSNGTLLSEVLALSGLSEPIAMGHVNSTTLAVVDGGNSHTIKYYDKNTGVLISSFGQQGGYAISSDVANDKFMFRNPKRFSGTNMAPFSYIVYQPDGSFWLGDQGNSRAMHFSNRTTLLNFVQFVGYHYSTRVDQNDITRVFSNYMEWEIDYTKPIAPHNGSWKLKRNWAYSVTSTIDDQYGRLDYVVTLRNKRTYALARITGNKLRVIELVTGGNIRLTNIQLPNLGYALRADGSLWNCNATSAINMAVRWSRQPLADFDADNNPVWGSAELIASIKSVNGREPVSSSPSGHLYNQLLSKQLICFSKDKFFGNRGDGYHLGAINYGETIWKWKTSASTNVNYRGEFPIDGYFDIGNNVNNAGNYMDIIDTNIFWGYYGEFWKGSQTNVFNHYNENGLFIGQFGVAKPKTELDTIAYPGHAGNNLSGNFLKRGADIYLFHCDESVHSGTLVWKISNLNSIQSFTIPFFKIGTQQLVQTSYKDLMTSLPFSVSNVSSTTSGLIRFPAENLDNATTKWTVKSGVQTYKREDRDLDVVLYTSLGTPASGTVSIPITNATLPTWSIRGMLCYVEPSEPEGPANANYMDVLDDKDRVIIRIQRGPNLTVNGQVFLPNAESPTNNKIVNKPRVFVMGYNGTSTYMQYNNGYAFTGPMVDPAANPQKPTRLQLYLFSARGHRHSINVGNLKLYE